MPTPYHRAAVHLRHASSVVICAHVRPDGDAIGSVLALTLALRQAGIPAVPTLADDHAAPDIYGFLPGFGLFTPAADLEVPDLFVALDTPGFGRLGVAEKLARAADSVVVIDHHPDNEEFGTVNVIDSKAAASGQMVWRLIERLEVHPSPEVALCCYVALMTDTGRFQYDNTTPEAFRDAAAMLEAGVDAAEASRLVYQERSPGSLAVEGIALSRLTIVNDGHVAYSWIADDDFERAGSLPVESEHLPDVVRLIGGVEVAMLLRVHPNEVRGNLRAKTGFDVGAVARVLGGGGHRAAAGFSVEGSLDETLARVLPLLPGAG
jgi:phosphoesterase RecJ-like protein